MRTYIRASEMHAWMDLACTAFWPHVQQDTPTRCWEWNGRTIDGRYGKVVFEDQHWCHAHRLSYYLHWGEIPAGQSVCHKCDNPRCVNPDHLWLGTHKANMADAANKGRSRSGRQKLTRGKAEELAARWSAGERMVDLAAECSVPHSSVSRAVHGQYKYARGISADPPRRIPRPAKITREQAKEIIARREAKESQSKIAADYGIDRSLVSRIEHRRYLYVSDL